MQVTVNDPTIDLTPSDTDCCAHTVRDGLSVTFPDGCTCVWDSDGFTFTHAHPDADCLVTFDESGPDPELN